MKIINSGGKEILDTRSDNKVKELVLIMRRLVKNQLQSAEITYKALTDETQSEYYRGKKEAYEVCIEVLDEIYKQIEIEETRK